MKMVSGKFRFSGIVLLMVLIMASSAYAAFDFTNLSEHYPMDDVTNDGGVNDSICGTGFCYNSTQSSFDNPSADGINNYGVYVGGIGTNGFELNQSLLNGRGNITMSIWVIHNNSYMANAKAMIYDSPTNVFGFYDTLSKFRSQAKSDDTPESQVDIPVLSINEWHMITQVSDGLTLKFYVDGVLNYSNALVGKYIYGDDIFFGCNFNALGVDIWNGTLDELMIFNSTMTAARVVELYNNGVGEFPSAAAAPTQISDMDLLFRNTTDPSYKVLFGEGENFYTYINWTDSENGSTFNATVGECNITILDSVLEEKTADQSFSLCDNIACDYSTYFDNISFHSIDNVTKDFARLEICHGDKVNEDLRVSINCSGVSYSKTIDRTAFPKCSDGTAIIIVNTTICIGEMNINVSVSNMDNFYDKRHTVTLLEMDREYSKHTNLNGTDILFNQSLLLWQTTHTEEFYSNGDKTVYANCSHIDSDYDNSTSEIITIVSTPPSISFDEVDYNVGIKQLYNLVEVPYFSGVWEWIVIVTGLDIETINYTFYNNSDYQIYSNFSLSPIPILTPDELFIGYGFFNLTVTANNSAGNITVSSIKFNITRPPDITVIYPNTTYNETYNIDIKLNFSTSIQTNCSVNNSLWVLQSSSGISHHYLETTAPDNMYILNISCNDSVGGRNYTVITFTKDTTIPSIITSSPAEDNGTAFFNDGSIDINSTFTDNIALYVYNVTIQRGGVFVFNESAVISGTSHIFGATIDTSNWLNTSYEETIRLCDAHSLGIIPDATGLLSLNSSIRYQFGDTWVKIRSMNGGEHSTKTEKLTDRYTTEFYYKDKTGLKAYELTSNADIDYLSKSIYKGHFIIGQMLWVDFENDKDAGISVEKTDEGYIIYVDNNDASIKFNSVGFLNCVRETYKFTLSAEPIEAVGYDINLLPTNFFNTEILDTSTVAGVLLFFFLFAVLICLVLFGEFSQIPAVMLLTSIYGFFLGILFYVSLSAIMGIVFIILSISYMIRSITFTGK